MTAYQPGDVVRVKTHAPHGTRLLAGDEVTVEVVKRDESDNVVLLVHTEGGRRALYATDVEPVFLTYRPAQPDPDVDAAFLELIAAEAADDLQFGALLADGDVALGAVEEDLSGVLDTSGSDVAVLDPEEETEEVNGTPLQFVSPADDDTHCLNITDAWGDNASFSYQEATDPHGHTHGRIMIFTDSEAGVSLRSEYLGRFISWLVEKHKRTN